jgi:hypothetical protein
MSGVSTGSTWSALFRLLLDLITKISQGKTADLVALSRLVTEKFHEVERTHELFLAILTKYQQRIEAIEIAAGDDERLEGEVKKFEAALRSTEALRSESGEQRRAAYEEAKVYAERGFVDRANILFSVPNEPIDNLRAFMLSYCNYFEVEGKYHHAVQGALDAGSATMQLAQARIQRSGNLDAKTRKLIRDGFKQLSSTVGIGIASIRSKWVPVASNYYKTIHSLRENGCPFSRK